MSSVKSNNNEDTKAKYEEQLRRMRDEYLKRENDMVKRHSKEVRRVSESYQNEISTIKENNEAQQKQFANRAKVALNSKDSYYQKKMNELKQFSREQMAKLRNESNQRHKITRDTHQKQEASMKKQNETRVRDMKGHYNSLLKKNEEINNERISTVLENQGKALQKQRKRMGDAHGKEVKSLVDYNAEQKARQQRAYDDLRQSSAIRMKSQNIRHIADKQRISEAHMEQTKQQTIEFGDQAKLRQAGFQDSLKEIRNDFINKDRENRKQAAINRQNLEETTNQRIQDTIQRLSNKIQSLKAENVRSETKTRRVSQREVEALRKQFNNNVQVYKDNQQVLIDAFNEQNADDLRKVKMENDKLIRDNTKFYQQKIKVADFKSKQALENLGSDIEARREQAIEQADNRIKIIRDDAEKVKFQEQSRHSNEIEILRNDAEQEKLNLRLTLQEEKNKSLNDMKDRIREVERRKTAKLQQMASTYNKKVAELNERHVADKAKMKSKTKNGIESLARVHRRELESTKIRYEQKLTEANFQHEKEVDRLNKRHQEQMDQLLTTFRKA